MSNNFRLTTLARAAALSMALAIPAVSGLATAAHADDMYGVGTQHGALIRQSAETAPSFGTAVGLALGKKAPQQQAFAGQTAAPVVSDAGATSTKRDLVGDGGHQDDVAREIYNPGTGTDW